MCVCICVSVWLCVHACVYMCVCVCYFYFILRLSQFDVVITTYGVVGSEGAAYLPAEVQEAENTISHLNVTTTE